MRLDRSTIPSFRNDVGSEKARMSRADLKGKERNAVAECHGDLAVEEEKENEKRSKEEWKQGEGNVGRLEYLSTKKTERREKGRERITIERRTDGAKRGREWKGPWRRHFREIELEFNKG